MANARSAWGIDIGNRALKAIKLVRTDSGALKVADFDVIEHDTPLSNAGDNRDALIQSALANFIQKHPDRKSVVGVSVSGSSSLARFIKLPPVEAKKIPDIVRFEAIQQIPFPLDEVEWSYQLFQGADSPEVEVGIFAMRKELINQHLKVFTDVGLNVEVVQLNPLAIYNAMQHDQRIDGATMIIDLGSENTDLIIADGQSIWLRSIPVGGKSFTEVLVKQFKLPFAKAEELKRTAATSKYAKQIFQAMRPVFADLVAEVQRSIGFYASVHRDSRLKKVLALGGTFRLPGLQKYLQQNLNLDVARVDRLEAGGPEEAKERANFDENLLSLATAYGLAIQAMGDAPITSSLLPASIRRTKQWKDKNIWFAAAAAAFVAGTAVAMGYYFLQNIQYNQHQGDRDQIRSVISEATSLDGDWQQQVESQGGGDHQRIANVQSMLWYRDLWPGLVQEIRGALPAPANPVLLTDDWDQIKKIPRAQRDVLQIVSITQTYDTDLSRLAPVAAVPGAPPAPAALGGDTTVLTNLPPNLIPPGAHGFHIKIQLVTPYGGDPVKALKFVTDTFVRNLRALRQRENKAGKTYTMMWADITSRELAILDPTYSRMLQSQMTSWQNATAAVSPSAAPAGTPAAAGTPAPAATGFRVPMQEVFPSPAGGAPFGGGAAAPAVVNTQTYIDPRTGENMKNDSLLEVTALVVITPPGTPYPALPPAGAAPGAAPQ